MPDNSETPADGPTDEAAADDKSTLANVASSIADAATQFASGARRLIAERPGARVRRVRRMGDEPLANLWELHPEARQATLRELAPRTVPVGLIAGTAVEGPVQRGGDFLPVRNRRGADWRARWQRILQAVDDLALLPPVDLIKYGDNYWVLDGHNRVGAALYTGQDDLDANVVEAQIPGVSAEREKSRIAPYLAEGSRDLRDAAAGRVTRTSHAHEPRLDEPE